MEMDIQDRQTIVLRCLAKRLNLNQVINEEFYKLKYCSTVVYMVPRA